VALDELAETLLRVSQLVAEIGEVAELDINPLLAAPTGVVALDARILLAPVTTASRRAGMEAANAERVRESPSGAGTAGSPGPS
jgi:hypothetical protein